MMSKLERALREEHGAVLVWFVIWLPVLFLFISFVLDAGNWWEHRRHLQTQADAAALAGGMEFAFPCSTSIADQIEGTARDYAGRHDGHTTPLYSAGIYNDQVGETVPADVHLLVNSIEFWNKGGTNYSDGGRPCVDTKFLDVKITEADLPFFFPFVDQFVPAINARARVEIQKIGSIGGEQLLPLFVRDVSPKSAAALFVRENADGTEDLLAAKYMQRASTCDSGFACWDNSTDPADVIIASATQATSLVVALSSLEQCTTSPAPCFDLSAGLTPQQICFQEGVECYWADDTTVRAGIVYIQGYTTSGGGAPPNQPALRGVGLAPGSSNACPDGYFAFTEVDCNVRVRATVDMGGFESSGDAQLRAFGANCPNNNGCPLTFDATSGAWEGDVEIPAVGNNPSTFTPTLPIEIRWVYRRVTMGGGVVCGNNFNNPPTGCAGTFGTAQRAFSGSDPFSGPIRSAAVYDPTTLSPANALAVSGLPHSLVAGVKLAGSVATSTSDPPIRLRVATNQGAVDCDPVITVTREEITRGCTPIYTFNKRSGQPDPCTPPFSPPTQLFSYDYNVAYSPNSSPGYDCVLTATGTTPNSIAAGMIGRIFNNRVPITPGAAGGVNVCPSSGPGGGYNNWSTSFPDFADDPRVVILFMVPFGAFRGSGQALYPITNFGAFYVTDWWGQSGGTLDDACGSDGSGAGFEGWISGHFINYRLPSNTTGGGGEECDPGEFTPCVVVLTE